MIVENIARALFLEFGEPKGFSIASIAYYLRTQVGTVNNLIFEHFKVTGNMQEITDCNGNNIRHDAVAIFQQVFRIYYYQVQVNNTMNALAVDNILQFQDNLGGSSIMRVNKNEMAKTFITIRKDEIAKLTELVSAYKIRKAGPQQVAGDDTASPLPYPGSQDTTAVEYSEYTRTI